MPHTLPRAQWQSLVANRLAGGTLRCYACHHYIPEGSPWCERHTRDPRRNGAKACPDFQLCEPSPTPAG